MGWTSISVYDWRIDEFKNSKGELDRKAYLDNEWNTENEEGKWEVLKSSMVGSTWYGAIRYTDKKNLNYTESPLVFGEVIITSIEKGEFYYKEMSEFCGPYQYKCPVGILNLLSPTESEHALEWRRKCENYHLLHNQETTFWKLVSKNNCWLKYILPKTINDQYQKGDEVWLHFGNIYRRGKVRPTLTDGWYRWTKKLVDPRCCTIYASDKKTEIFFAWITLNDDNESEDGEK